MPSPLLVVMPASALPPLLTLCGVMGQRQTGAEGGSEGEAGKQHVVSKALANGCVCSSGRNNLMLF